MTLTLGPSPVKNEASSLDARLMCHKRLPGRKGLEGDGCDAEWAREKAMRGLGATAFTEEHRGSQALSLGSTLCLGSVREQTDFLQTG